MKKLSIIIAATALLMGVASCDKIDDPLKPVNIAEGTKTVLIKDFTGAMCVNCPNAAEYAHNLQHELGKDRIIILSVHAGPLAQPMGQFPDFLTDEGTLWYGNHDSNPLFTVDHVGLTDGNTLYVEKIDTPVASALQEEAAFDINISNDFDETSRQLKVESEVMANADLDGQYYVTVCLVEDSLVGWQKTMGGLDKEYVFHNVFRGTLNGADGEKVGNGSITLDDQYVFTHNMELDTLYNANQCYSLTYVYDKADGKILQTAIQKIK